MLKESLRAEPLLVLIIAQRVRIHPAAAGIPVGPGR